MGNRLFPAFPSELLVWFACSKVQGSNDQDSLEDDIILHIPLSVPLSLISQEWSPRYVAREECHLPTRVLLGQSPLLSRVRVVISQTTSVILKYAPHGAILNRRHSYWCLRTLFQPQPL